jgi:hypothetical protein
MASAQEAPSKAVGIYYNLQTSSTAYYSLNDTTSVAPQKKLLTLARNTKLLIMGFPARGWAWARKAGVDYYVRENALTAYEKAPVLAPEPAPLAEPASSYNSSSHTILVHGEAGTTSIAMGIRLTSSADMGSIPAVNTYCLNPRVSLLRSLV